MNYEAVKGTEQVSAKDSPNIPSSHPNKGKYTGINPKRHTTDCLCFLMILALWVAMTVVGIIASKDGDLYRLIGPINSDGDICGFSPSVENEKYFYTVLTDGLGSCVSSCFTYDAPLTSTTPSDYVCLDAYYYLFPTDSSLSDYIASYCISSSTNEYDISLNCGCNIIRQTNSHLRRCRFDDDSVKSYYSTQNGLNYLQSFIADIITARIVIFCFGFLVSLFLAFFFTYLLQHEWIGSFIIWTLIWVVLGALVYFAVNCNRLATTWSSENPRNFSATAIRGLRALGVILGTVAVLFFFVMIYLRRSINIAIKTVSLAARAIDDMSFLIFTPFLQVFGFICFFVPFLFYCFFLASEGTFTNVYATIPGTSEQYLIGKSYKLASGVEGKLWFMFVCLLWTMNFITAIGSMIIAISCSKWYFTSSSERSKFTSLNVLGSYLTTFRYHLGTLAFGSLLITMVEVPKAIAMYFQRYSKTVKKNYLLKYLLFCIICLLSCLERCLKFISKNAYIQTAIHSTSFLQAAKDGFFVIARNIFTVGAVTVISDLALIIIKFFVAGVVTACGYFYLLHVYQSKMYDLTAPTALILIISWMTVTMFTDVFRMCIDTMLMCYITDSEDNNGSPMFASDSLKSFLEKHGKLEASPKVSAATVELTGISPRSAAL